MTPSCDLLALPHSLWPELVKAAGASVVHRLHSREWFSFILSESSLLVSSQQLVLLTCGNSAPPAILPLLSQTIGQQHIHSIQYEEKGTPSYPFDSLHYQRQLRPLLGLGKVESHKVEGSQGERLMLSRLGPATSKPLYQLLLHHCQPERLQPFNQPGPKPASPLAALLPHCQRHSHLFSPSGYSENGFGPQGYYTLHITPQHPSYVGFETDLPKEQALACCEELHHLFQPQWASILHQSPDLSFDLIGTFSINGPFCIT